MTYCGTVTFWILVGFCVVMLYLIVRRVKEIKDNMVIKNTKEAKVKIVVRGESNLGETETAATDISLCINSRRDLKWFRPDSVEIYYGKEGREKLGEVYYVNKLLEE